MNPKIFDFGIRICGENDAPTNTQRVFGTW
jgi:hypothetical protein